MDQAVGLRQEQIQVLQRRRVRRKKRKEKNPKRCHVEVEKQQTKWGFFFLLLLLHSLTEASSPDSTPGFLLRSRCSRLLEYSSLEHRA